MEQTRFDRIAVDVAGAATRRSVLRRLAGLLGALAALFGGDAVGEVAVARRRGNGRRRCPRSRRCGRRCCGARQPCVLDCSPQEIADGFCGQSGRPPARLCCPAAWVYVVCPTPDGIPPDKRCPDPTAPAVCCHPSKICGYRCCEGGLTCKDASTSECSDDPAGYARLRRV